MPRAAVSIVVAGSHLDRFGEVVAGVRRAGLEVAREMPLVGVIAGDIDAAHLRDLAAVEGVETVETERPVGVPPPDCGIQ